ncbi:hypothetical protein [Sphingomonas sp. LaA6.9]|uniref:hypothetical protein n=1 Tax=Sphingomonas sp. LaA6.9 TaxID=2919914 RepID=UPI001F4F4D80|nr:hypothetical protein [Sphingomonas sp. LaA6.9]MCJ8156169.1 hypothetical protein [Sphingomonas sp. LaA6.9]
MRKTIFAGALAGMLLTGGAMPAIAQDQPAADSEKAAAVSVGATVVDTSGAPVGTVESVADDMAVISTGAAKVRVPVSALAAGEKGLTIGITKAELEAKAKPQ